MLEVYKDLFHHQYLQKNIFIYFDQKNKTISFLDIQQSSLQQLITTQRIFVYNALIKSLFFILVEFH